MSHRGPRYAAKKAGKTHYFTGKPCKNGHIAKRYVDGGKCVACGVKYSTNYYHANADAVLERKSAYYSKPANKARKMACTERWRKESHLKHRFSVLKSSAPGRGQKFTLKFEDLQYPEKCPALGVKLDYRKRGRGAVWNSPTVDRINSKLGYVPGNVIVVSHLANRIKSNATPEQITRVAKFYSKLPVPMR